MDCDPKCDGCSGGDVSNCIQCAANSFRINPPYCECMYDYYDDGQNA